MQTARSQNLTIRLSPDARRKAKALAAERDTTVTRLLAGLLEELVGRDKTFDAAKRAALDYLDKGFPLGGKITAGRGEWHER